MEILREFLNLWGNNQEALPLRQKALEIHLEQLGDRHPDTATSYNNLAGLYKFNGAL